MDYIICLSSDDNTDDDTYDDTYDDTDDDTDDDTYDDLNAFTQAEVPSKDDTIINQARGAHTKTETNDSHASTHINNPLSSSIGSIDPFGQFLVEFLAKIEDDQIVTKAQEACMQVIFAAKNEWNEKRTRI